MQSVIDPAVLEGIDHEVQEVFENQRRVDGSSTFNAAALEEGDPSRWCTHSLVSVTPNTHPVPPGHSVLKQWVMVVDPQITDSGGWMYAPVFVANTWFGAPKSEHKVRRRRWVRITVLSEMLEEAQRRVESSAANSPRGIVMQGKLVKRGHIRTNWLERWFIIEGGRLEYYSQKPLNDQERAKFRKGSVGLKNATVMAVPRFNFQKSNVFEVNTRERVLYLQASSIDEMEQWTNTISREIRLLNYGTDSDNVSIGKASSVVPSKLDQQPSARFGNSEKKADEEVKEALEPNGDSKDEDDESEEEPASAAVEPPAIVPVVEPTAAPIPRDRTPSPAPSSGGDAAELPDDEAKVDINTAAAEDEVKDDESVDDRFTVSAPSHTEAQAASASLALDPVVTQGASVQKKRSKESRYRTRFVWIDPVGKSFNWSKTPTKDGKHKLVQADLMSRVVSSAPTKALRRSSLRLQHCLTIELKDEGTEGHIDLMFTTAEERDTWLEALNKLLA